MYQLCFEDWCNKSSQALEISPLFTSMMLLCSPAASKNTCAIWSRCWTDCEEWAHKRDPPRPRKDHCSATFSHSKLCESTKDNKNKLRRQFESSYWRKTTLECSLGTFQPRACTGNWLRDIGGQGCMQMLTLTVGAVSPVQVMEEPAVGVDLHWNHWRLETHLLELELTFWKCPRQREETAILSFS